MDENSVREWGGLYPRVLCPNRVEKCSRQNSRRNLYQQMCMIDINVAGHCEFMKYVMFSLILIRLI